MGSCSLCLETFLLKHRPPIPPLFLLWASFVQRSASVAPEVPFDCLLFGACYFLQVRTSFLEPDIGRTRFLSVSPCWAGVTEAEIPAVTAPTEPRSGCRAPSRPGALVTQTHSGSSRGIASPSRWGLSLTPSCVRSSVSWIPGLPCSWPTLVFVETVLYWLLEKRHMEVTSCLLLLSVNIFIWPLYLIGGPAE